MFLLPCVPDAVQREALAKRCTADPGPPQTRALPGLQRTTIVRGRRGVDALKVLRCAQDTEYHSQRKLLRQVAPIRIELVDQSTLAASA